MPIHTLKNNLLVLLAPLILVGCGTMSREECTSSDWNHVGFIDGRMGKKANHIEEHRRLCGASVPDQVAYEDGRQRGVKDYCTPRSAYNEGSRGHQLEDVCPAEMTQTLWPHYNEGLKTHELKVEREVLRSELAEKREKIDSDKSVVGDIAKAYNLLSGTSQTRKEEERIEDLSDKIYARNANAPVGPASVATLQERIEANPFPAARNMLAVVTGSVFGFGLGHSIKGTYSEQGWKWTAIDVANIVGLGVNSANCTTEVDPMTGERGSKTTGACIGSTLVLVSGLIVSRVWQGIELGKDATRSYSPYAVMVEPRQDGSSLVATWKW